MGTSNRNMVMKINWNDGNGLCTRLDTSVLKITMWIVITHSRTCNVHFNEPPNYYCEHAN